MKVITNLLSCVATRPPLVVMLAVFAMTLALGALAGSAFTTTADYEILMTVPLVPFQQLELVTAYTILLALVGAVLVPPSLLVWWDRWHRRGGGKATGPAKNFVE